MSRAIKTAEVTYGSATYLTDLESVPVGVPIEREIYDISALGDTVKVKAASQAVEKGEFDIEILYVGAITDDGKAKQLQIKITPNDGPQGAAQQQVTIDFGYCFLTKVDPGSASTGDKKATQKLTFCPEGITSGQQSNSPAT